MSHSVTKKFLTGKNSYAKQDSKSSKITGYEQMNKAGRPVKTDVVSRIAWLYFMKGYTQRNISEMLGLSRMQVQRSISRSRTIGLVQIQIVDPLTSCFEKEDELKTRFSLADVVVMPTPEDRSKLKEALGKAAASYLLRKARDNQIIGVGWGTTLHEITRFVSKKPLTRCRVVSLVGGWTKRTDESPYEVAGKVASALNADCYYISAPAVADSARSRSIIASETSINQALSMARKSDLAVLGIGNATDGSSLVKAGILSAEEVKQLRSVGAAGDICAHFYDREGIPVASSYMKRVIGVGLEDLRNIPMVIGVAGGENKEEAIFGALSGGYLDTLITDEETAMGVLSLTGKNIGFGKD